MRNLNCNKEQREEEDQAANYKVRSLKGLEGGRRVVDLKRERRVSSCPSSGKQVVLAAIVHHLDWHADDHHSDTNSNYVDSLGEAKLLKTNPASCDSGQEGAKKVRQDNNTHILEATIDDHQDEKSRNGKTIKSKFSKLFSKNTTTKQIKTTSTRSRASTLIDNGTEEKSENVASGQPAAGRKAGGSGGGGNNLLDCSEKENSNSSQEVAKTQRAFDSEQVIEFKFDLIVEESMRRKLESMSRRLAGGQQNGKPNGYLKDNAKGQAAEETPPWAGERTGTIEEGMALKLNDNVNELIESFVLDSSDVCLMSTGKEQVELVNSKDRFGGLRQVGEFEFVCRLARQSLAYSFELLEASSGLASERSSPSLTSSSKLSEPNNHHELEFHNNPSNEQNLNTSSKRSHPPDYSIELSATMFLSRTLPPVTPTQVASAAADNQFGLARPNEYQIIDLLSADCSLNGARKTSWLDCRDLKSALSVMKELECKLADLKDDDDDDDSESGHEEFDSNRSGKLLLIGLKLKQRIHGGLFSNRLSIIDFDTKFSELNQLFESIFNGQALAYLRKRHKSIKDYQDLAERAQASRDASKAAFGCSPASSGPNEHHQVASERKKLYQAEWSLYKQLSSALIRALLIVHVHKGQGPADEACQQERLLMGENLRLLEFARTIQRASLVRLRRRKRHLRSHLAASSNASLASNNSALNTTVSHVRQHPEYQHSSLLSKNCRSSRCERFELEEHARSRKLSLSNNPIKRDQHQHHRNHHHHRNYHHYRRHKSSCAERAATRPQEKPRNPYAEFLTESSSISTSTSGSQSIERSGQMDSKWSQGNKRQVAGGSFISDTDSVASVNLNSYSSSSFNHRFPGQSSLSAAGNKDKSRQRRDIELKWLSKQKSNSPFYLNLPARSGQKESPIELSDYNSQLDRRNSSPSNERFVRESSVIQIDCQSPLKVANNLLKVSRTSETGLHSEHEPDNMSDICSVVAEPPKQLKLEEFLNQFSNIIASPMKAPTVSSEERSELPSELQELGGEPRELERRTEMELQFPLACPNGTNLTVDEDDEDCKSHSSILEHLSSLALESRNTRLLNKDRSAASHERLSSAGQQAEQAHQIHNRATGHLQRLLNCSNRRPPVREAPYEGPPRASLEEQLRALSISCLEGETLQPAGQQLSSPSTSSGAFALSSDSNSCSSSLSPAASELPGAKRPDGLSQRQALYTMVGTRANVKT